ncbi:hypothetical protein ZWY2020_010450 [Hordeum vulgare]|nr:hypothetical protein ZWY2020_010450 [Hordeum vulgare]
MNPPTASAGAGYLAAPAPTEHASYPTLSPEDLAPPPPPAYHVAASYASPASGGNPYVSGPAGSVPPPKSESQIWPRLPPIPSGMEVNPNVGLVGAERPCGGLSTMEDCWRQQRCIDIAISFPVTRSSLLPATLNPKSSSTCSYWLDDYRE